MNNYHLDQLRKHNQQVQEKKEVANQQNSRDHKSQKIQLTSKVYARLENYCATRFPKDYITSLQNGSIPILPLEFHMFRDRQPAKELAETGVTIKNYQTSKDRAETASQDFRNTHLEKGIFNEKEPHKYHKNWLRVDQLPKEGQPLRFGKNPRLEIERVQEEIKKNQILDSCKRDIKMINLPQWKIDEKEKWISNKNFNNNPRLQQKMLNESVWQNIPINLQNQNNFFNNGYENSGNLERKRVKEMEVGDEPDFLSTVKNDIMSTVNHFSSSLRTFKQDKILNVPEDYQVYSSNSQISWYKKGLIVSKCVDYQYPYQHSNNFKSVQLTNLRPKVNNKIFIKSVEQHDLFLIPTKGAVVSVKELKAQDRQKIQQRDLNLEKVKSSINENKTTQGEKQLLELSFNSNQKVNNKRNQKRKVQSMFQENNINKKESNQYVLLGEQQTKQIIDQYFD